MYKAGEGVGARHSRRDVGQCLGATQKRKGSRQNDLGGYLGFKDQQMSQTSAKPLDRAMLSHRLGTRWQN